MSELKDHDFKNGQWFYALDGSVYEYIDGDEGSRKICEVVDLEKTIFMSKQMKGRGNLIATAPEMYDLLASIGNDEDQVPAWLWDKIQLTLAKARGEK